MEQSAPISSCSQPQRLAMRSRLAVPQDKPGVQEGGVGTAPEQRKAREKPRRSWRWFTPTPESRLSPVPQELERSLGGRTYTMKICSARNQTCSFSFPEKLVVNTFYQHMAEKARFGDKLFQNLQGSPHRCPQGRACAQHSFHDYFPGLSSGSSDACWAENRKDASPPHLPF